MSDSPGLRGLNAPSGADNGLRGLNAPSGADITVTPAPTEAEVAAIMAAYEALWPKPPAPDATKGAPAQWRFSGRWWNKPVLRSPHG